MRDEFLPAPVVYQNLPPFTESLCMICPSMNLCIDDSLCFPSIHVRFSSPSELIDTAKIRGGI